jgi:carbonic anhydrase/acetyltransferase-like protein (isoleucine patch superfamily)
MQIPYKDKTPQIHPTAWIAPTAVVVGDVVIGKDSSIWFHCVVRGDVNYIRIGNGSNVQDGSVLHVTTAKYPLTIGNNVTIGHSVMAHGCVIEDDCLIGMRAVLLDGVVVGEGSLIGAGALITPGTVIPPRSLVMGFPAKVVRELSLEEVEENNRIAPHYCNLAREYKSKGV